MPNTGDDFDNGYFLVCQSEEVKCPYCNKVVLLVV